MSNTALVQNNQYLVDLALFQGPLDLLLHLIKRDEVEIYDIHIAKITRQYLEYMELMSELNIEVAGEYILMAASLIRMKTRMLLPHDEGETEEDDPRHELMLALIEYRKFKEAGEILRDKAIIEEGKVVPPSPFQDVKIKTDLDPGTTLFDLMAAFKELLAERQEEISHNVNREEISVPERVEFILTYLENREFATFKELFADMPRKIVAVVTFIALLEMVRLRRIVMRQSKLFEELRVYRGDNFDIRQEPTESVTEPLVRETVES